MKKHIILSLVAVSLTAFSSSSFAYNSKAESMNMMNVVVAKDCGRSGRTLSSGTVEDGKIYYKISYQCSITTVYIKNKSDSDARKYTFYVDIDGQEETVSIPAGEYWRYHFDTDGDPTISLKYSSQLCLLTTKTDENGNIKMASTCD